ncbi:SsrA-binding protein SmpB [Candidatus Falkowbacteria bacterium]|nr:SsrA-binding protein SmpB [Candidatus Falkowbacteria bacterium]NCQ12953.1 SsrA-binding protein SmpB [Candidatus Falkowbacteria bacterium]OIO06661.1 MAG: SsrA-binding protein [Candidatus Falkowbacteria bacterium CG1_02_37_21]
MPQLAHNRKANFEYELLDRYEAGLVLSGNETKAVKAGQISLKGSFISPRNNKGKVELYLLSAYISPYKSAASPSDWEPTRERKLLLHRQEINRLIGKKLGEGLTLIPLKIYTKHSFLKLEFAIARGKKKYDKRESIKKRELDRSLRSLTKRQMR